MDNLYLQVEDGEIIWYSTGNGASGGVLNEEV